jgi:putative transposase
VLETLNSERFVDQAPAEVHAELLDEGRYRCSVRTMYRILRQSSGVRERRDQLRHPHYPKPQLRAAAPNQVWSWDITKLLGPNRRNYYHLYVILDIYSRAVVGWIVAYRESAALARAADPPDGTQAGYHPRPADVCGNPSIQMPVKPL